MNEQVIEDCVTYHAECKYHHAPDEEVGTVNVVYYARYYNVKQFNISRGTQIDERWR